ncbi:hypothetical protein GCM10020220_101860 [Nonomuraea rubra]|uniref:hypothetical protein n=1 Tax=Nonomuraea rubra TaxID=46180 RepID=UPI0031E693A5
MLVNGAVAHAASAFDPTGAWTSWGTKTLAVSLNAGDNIIRLSPTTADGLANIDYLETTRAARTRTRPAGRWRISTAA